MSLALLAAWAGWAHGATVTLEGRLTRVEGEQLFLSTAQGELAFKIVPKSRCWWLRREVKPSELPIGTPLRAKVIEGPAPREIREVADAPSAAWLDQIRKSPVSGRIRAIEGNAVVVDLGEDTLFRYRFSAKSRWEVAGQAVEPASLAPGTTLLFRGRLLPSYDTWLVSATDTPPPASTSGSRAPRTPQPKSEPKPKPGPATPTLDSLPATGRFDAVVEAWIPTLGFLDVFRNGIRTHVRISPQTVFTVDGVRGDVRSAERGLKCRIHYRRDPYGRILAVRVDLEAVEGLR